MRWSNPTWAVFVIGLAGCVADINPRSPVRVQPTRTPGVAMVLVKPEFTRSRNTGEIDRGSEYILLCDGRPAEGMRCHVLPEVGADRRSWAVAPDAAGPKIDLGVATLADVDIAHSKEAEDKEDEPAAPEAAPVDTAVPPTPAPSGTVAP